VRLGQIKRDGAGARAGGRVRARQRKKKKRGTEWERGNLKGLGGSLKEGGIDSERDVGREPKSQSIIRVVRVVPGRV
jgi:hypothetical protein